MQSWELHDGKVQIGPLEEDHVVRMIEAGLPVETLVRPVGQDAWKALRTHAPFAMALERLTGPAGPAAAPASAHVVVVQAPPPPAVTAKRIKKSEFIGAGCVVQGLGFGAPVLGFLVMGPIGSALGLVALLVLFLIGSRMASFFACGACGSKLGAPEATRCQACRAELTG